MQDLSTPVFGFLAVWGLAVLIHGLYRSIAGPPSAAPLEDSRPE